MKSSPRHLAAKQKRQLTSNGIRCIKIENIGARQKELGKRLRHKELLTFVSQGLGPTLKYVQKQLKTYSTQCLKYVQKQLKKTYT